MDGLWLNLFHPRHTVTGNGSWLRLPEPPEKGLNGPTREFKSRGDYTFLTRAAKSSISSDFSKPTFKISALAS